MLTLRNIVVATDFSEFSERVVQRAAQLAKRENAELHLLHVVRPLDLYPGMTLTPDEFGHQDQELLQTEQGRLEAMALNLAGELDTQVHAASRLGRAHTEAATYAQEVGADLLVAGARGENTLMDLLLGSTASRLLRVAGCPVLIVRRPGDEPYRKVLAAVDFSPVSASVVAHARLLAGEAPVEVLHVLGSEVEQRLRRAKSDRMDMSDWLQRRRSDAEKQLEALIAPHEDGRQIERLVEPGFAPAAICQCVDERAVDLVVLGRHGYGGGLQDWLLGSVSKDVALAARADVLLISRPDPVED